jgi:hypothetical protein
MKRMFWVDQRFSWSFVFAVAYLTLSLVAADYVWRVVVMPFDTLLIYVVAAEGTVAILLIGVYRALCQRRAQATIKTPF